ncbi:hypothetical protein JJB09_12390 [Rhizobium sp. KVB221]|uniref:Uncharacterized protein n=1 Tax=Rhizobium setariae TaxID=2801340 RepID=A0A936YNN6_9HYPH|nr:hypothetical protein [Rhizobium setariae]MBL0372828.1 hypothetical protein [Rhizobium setariae]
MSRLLLVAGLIGFSSIASAQEAGQALTSFEGASMGRLLSEGYEIKAAIPNGKKFVVFLQKDSTGYACEMVNLTRSQCGEIK